MPLTPDRRLRVRIAGALALVVAVNGLVLSALVWSGLRVLSASGRSPPIEIGLPLSVGAILLGAIGLVAVQARYGTRTVVAGFALDEVEGDGPRTVAARVRRLAAQADVPLPSVAVADLDEPGCLTVGTQRSPTIVVTTGLLERLDDDELDAALAHEVAHVANRDLPVVTAVAATVELGERLLERERMLHRVLRVLWPVAVLSGVGFLAFVLPLVVIGLGYLLGSAVARALLGVNAIALGLFSKAREYAADRGACALTGDPAALASALESLEDDRPARDARLHASATLGIVPRPLSLEGADDEEEHWLEPWLPDPALVAGPDAERESTSRGLRDRVGQRLGERFRARVVTPVTGRVRRTLGRRPPTHPATEDRIERLRTIERRRWK